MSARLNMNEIRPFSWKGKTFIQIYSSIQKNGDVNENIVLNNNKNIFNPSPLKIYRREIASVSTKNCNERISTKVDLLDMPNGYQSTNITYTGLKGVVDINVTNNTTEHPGICTDTYICTEKNARNRVRSSGMIKRKFDKARNNDTYYTSSNQYLVSRNRTFQQNQYNYLQAGDSSSKPGDTLSISNIYAPSGINHCPKYFISSGASFQYIWLDGNTYTVVIVPGYYDIDALNTLFKNTMFSNNHYFINRSTNSQVYLLNISYNNNTNNIILQCLPASTTIFDSTTYKTPTGISWTNPLTSTIPHFIITSNIFQNAIGFQAGQYPATAVTTNYYVSSSFSPGLKPNYVPLYYKPNNSQFSQQGGVSASALIARLRYNTITNNTAVYYKAYGRSVANALAYGVPENGYTMKDKIGYPLTKTPIFSKVTGNLINCSSSDCTIPKMK